MRIYTFRLKKALIISSLLILVISFGIVACMQSGSVAAVFSTDKDLPIYSVECNEKVASITFDCAWGADDIPDILKTLETEDIKASFFIVGQWAEKYPDAVKMISDKGHDIANHSYSHARFGALDNSAIRNDITKCGSVLSGITGKKTNLFRAPYGDYNNSVIAAARELGYQTIQWDTDSLDWKVGISPEEIQKRVMKKVKSGSIILFHNDTPHTAKILPSIIKSLKQEGYSFKPVSELILKDNYFIDIDGTQKVKK